MTKRLTANLPLGAVLLLALALRVWGLEWGLPSATHYFSYHPDESMVLAASMRMNLFRGQLLPHFYNYGSLQLYLILIANTLDYLFGHGSVVIQNYAVQHSQWARQYLVGRLLAVGMGVGTVGATYALGARLWGRRAGLLGALILAIMPLHAQHSHWLTVDVPATFWATLSLLWSARLATGDPKPLRAAIVAGVFAGLAAATKYNLALVLFPLVLAALPSPLRGPCSQSLDSGVTGWPRNEAGRGSLRRVAVGLCASAFAFLAACPGILADRVQFWHDFDYEAYHVRRLPGAEFTDTGSGFVYQIARNLDAGLGLPLLLLCLTAIVYALWRRERGDGLLAAFALPYYVLIGLAVVRYARYVIPLLPMLALWAGRLLADLSRLSSPVARWAGIAAGAAVLLGTLGYCVWLIRPMASPDDRDVALARLDGMNAATVGFAVQPWFPTPPVSPWFCAPIPGTWRQQTPPGILARIVYARDWDTQSLETLRPPVVVLSEYDYDDPLRLQNPAALAYLRALRQQYRVQAVIAGPEGFSKTRDGLPTRGLPSDMLYTDPIISIYVRK